MKSRASLDWLAKILTAFVLALILFMAWELSRAETPTQTWSMATGAAILLGITIFSFLYATTSYEIKDAQLIIHRRIGPKTFDLKKLKNIAEFRNIKKGIPIRTFGNGGLFGYFGYYYNDGIGNYRVYASRYKSQLILEFEDSRISISPDDEEFGEKLRYWSKEDHFRKAPVIE